MLSNVLLSFLQVVISHNVTNIDVQSAASYNELCYFVHCLKLNVAQLPEPLFQAPECVLNDDTSRTVTLVVEHLCFCHYSIIFVWGEEVFPHRVCCVSRRWYWLMLQMVGRSTFTVDSRRTLES